MTPARVLTHRNAATVFMLREAISTAKNNCVRRFSFLLISHKTKSDLERSCPGLSDSKSGTVFITLLFSRYSPSLSTCGSLVIALGTVFRIEMKQKKDERVPSLPSTSEQPWQSERRENFLRLRLTSTSPLRHKRRPFFKSQVQRKARRKVC